MVPFQEALQKEILVAMGPLGTNLHERGMLQLGCSNTSLWCLENKETYVSFLREWMGIGCDIIYANTSALNPLLLEVKGGLAGARRINAQLTAYGREAASSSAYLAADLQSVILSTGRFLPPLGDLSREELYESYRVQAQAFGEAGADLVWLMTMAELEEVKIALQAVRDAAELPVLVSFAFDRTKTGFRALMGSSAKDAASCAEEMGADGVGTNCGGITPGETADLVKEISTICDLPVIAMPSAGTPHLRQGRTIYPVGPEEMAREAVGWVEAGARIISGCCGSTLEHIAHMIRDLRNGGHIGHRRG